MIGAALGYKVKLCLPERRRRNASRSLRPTASRSSTRPGMKAPTAPSAACAKSTPPSPTNISTPTSTAIPPTGGALQDHRPGDLASRPQGRDHAFRRRPRHQRHLRRHHAPPERVNPEIRCISMQPDSGFHGLEGLKHMATAIVPAIYDPNLADENMEVRTEDALAHGPPPRARRGHSSGRERRRGAVGKPGGSAPHSRKPSAR